MVMKTDTARVKRTDPGNPDNCTVFTYYDFFALDLKAEVDRGCRSAALGCVDCKKQLLTRFIPAMQPFSEKRRELAEKPNLVNEILHTGAERARRVTVPTLQRVKDAMGMISRYTL